MYRRTTQKPKKTLNEELVKKLEKSLDMCLKKYKESWLCHKYEQEEIISLYYTGFLGFLEYIFSKKEIDSEHASILYSFYENREVCQNTYDNTRKANGQTRIKIKMNDDQIYNIQQKIKRLWKI